MTDKAIETDVGYSGTGQKVRKNDNQLYAEK
jgi:hypothetical protein